MFACCASPLCSSICSFTPNYHGEGEQIFCEEILSKPWPCPGLQCKHVHTIVLPTGYGHMAASMGFSSIAIENCGQIVRKIHTVGAGGARRRFNAIGFALFVEHCVHPMREQTRYPLDGTYQVPRFPVISIWEHIGGTGHKLCQITEQI